jgi:hypothetical protein
MSRLRVRRKGYIARRGGKTYRVPPTTYYIKDRGSKGRGRQYIPPLKEGALGIKFADGMSDEQIKRILAKQVRRYGEKVVVGRLMALAVLNKRTNPELSAKCKKWAHWVAGSFKGRKYVGYPRGFA